MEELGILWAEPMDAIAIQSRYSNTPEKPHVTLAWGVPRAKYDVIGLTTSIYLDAECWSDRIQAVRCTLQAGIPFELEIPHLTVSWVDGVAPRESTAMLQRVHDQQPIEQILPCKIEWVPLQDSAVAWRIKALEAIAHHSSVYKAAEALGVARTTLSSRFNKLPKGHPDRVAYKALVAQHKGGWKAGRSRK